jgi:peptide/nickel transport system permease protein
VAVGPARSHCHRVRPNPLLTYMIRRFISAIVLLFVVSAVTFAIFFLLPRLAGATADDLASRYVGKSAGPEQIHAAAVRLGFTDPIWVQYGRFAKGIVVGSEYNTGATIEQCPAPCLGYSFITQNPVLPDLLDRLPVTLSLAAGAAVLWLFGGVATGVVSALKRGSPLDRTAMGIALAGVSLPIFFTGLLALSIFSYGLGWTAQGGSYTPFQENPAQWAYDLLLPWITLSFLYAAAYARLTRAGMLETMNEDYIRTARAKGLKEHDVVVRHGLRAALTPILTIFGLDLGLLLGGAILTESTFSLNGIGKYAVDAVANNDLPKVLGVTLLGATFIVIANLVVDLLYAVVDPRVRVS